MWNDVNASEAEFQKESEEEKECEVCGEKSLTVFRSVSLDETNEFVEQFYFRFLMTKRERERERERMLPPLLVYSSEERSY